VNDDIAFEERSNDEASSDETSNDEISNKTNEDEVDSVSFYIYPLLFYLKPFLQMKFYSLNLFSVTANTFLT